MTQRARWPWHRIVAAALLVHVAIGVVRVPGVVWGRRLANIDEYRSRGAVGFVFDAQNLRGAAVVQWILDNVPNDAVVLWRGNSKGALEFVPGLIAPRLLVQESACPPAARDCRGRPLAVRVTADGAHVVVLNGGDEELSLEAR